MRKKKYRKGSDEIAWEEMTQRQRDRTTKKDRKSNI
jgi:hypothetical protein